MSPDIVQNDLSSESYREYDFGGRVYRIDNPKTLYFRKGGSTHRVVDQLNVVHLLPGPGYRDCVIRWVSKNPESPVSF